MHSDGLLSQVLDHIRQRAGKRMRPILILLMARNFGKVSRLPSILRSVWSCFIPLRWYMMMW